MAFGIVQCLWWPDCVFKSEILFLKILKNNLWMIALRVIELDFAWQSIANVFKKRFLSKSLKLLDFILSIIRFSEFEPWRIHLFRAISRQRFFFCQNTHTSFKLLRYFILVLVWWTACFEIAYSFQCIFSIFKKWSFPILPLRIFIDQIVSLLF